MASVKTLDRTVGICIYSGIQLTRSAEDAAVTVDHLTSSVNVESS